MACSEVGQGNSDLIHIFTFSAADDNNEMISFTNTCTSDDGHQDCIPHRVFDQPGLSRMQVEFTIQDMGNIKALVLHLKHCRANNLNMIDIDINEKPYKQSYKYALRYNFGWQEFRIGKPFLRLGENTIAIRTSEGSEGEYWLSDLIIHTDHSASINLLGGSIDTEDGDSGDSEDSKFGQEALEHIKSIIEDLKEIALEKAVWGEFMLDSGKAETLANDIGKLVIKEGEKSVLKKIPLLGTAVGAGLAVKRAKEGDYLKALGELWSGIFSDLPGAGTAISLAIDSALLASDIAQAIKTAKKNKREAERHLDELTERERRACEQLDVYHAPEEIKEFAQNIKVVRGQGQKQVYQRALSEVIEGLQSPTENNTFFTVQVDELKEAHDREIKRGSFYHQVFDRCFQWVYTEGHLWLILLRETVLDYPLGTSLRAVNLHLQEQVPLAAEDLMIQTPEEVYLKLNVRSNEAVIRLDDLSKTNVSIRSVDVGGFVSTDISGLERSAAEDACAMTEAFDLLRTPLKELDDFRFHHITEENINGIVAFLAATHIADSHRSVDHGIIQVQRIERMLSTEESYSGEVSEVSPSDLPSAEQNALSTLIASVSGAARGVSDSAQDEVNKQNHKKRRNRSKATIDSSATENISKLLKDRPIGSVVPFEFYILGHGPATLEIRMVGIHQIQIIDFFFASVEGAEGNVTEADIRALIFMSIREIVPGHTTVLDEHGHIV